jgi:inorganic triphosphatase YgiF
MTHSFEQQPKESAKAFAAFREYLNLGAERSLAAVARKLAKSEQLLKRWSARFDWAGRVQAHAAHLATVERLAAEGVTRDKAAERAARELAVREQEWDTREEAVTLAREAIGRWRASPEKCGSLEGIARLLELASVLGRRSTGMALDRSEVTGEDGGPIRVEFEAALRKVYGPVVEAEVVGTKAESGKQKAEIEAGGVR